MHIQHFFTLSNRNELEILYSNYKLSGLRKQNKNKKLIFYAQLKFVMGIIVCLFVCIAE
jgi:hypothetical protein